MGNKNSRDGEVVRMPHGLALISSSLKRNGFSVGLIDMRIVDGWNEFEEKVKKLKTCKYWGISINNIDFEYGVRASYIIKKIISDSCVVVGGLNPSLFPDNYKDIQTIDYVIMGDGEISFPKLIKGIKSNEKFPRYIRGEKPNLDEIPWADRDLFDYKRETLNKYVPDQKRPVVSIIASRGCPFSCSYCQPAERDLFGLPIRMRSPQNVINELLLLYEKYHFKSVNTWDDMFMINNEWIYEFCDLYEKHFNGIQLTACCRADIICRNENMIKRLADVGLKWLQIGFESGSQRLLNFIKKGTTVEQNILAGRICKKHRIKMLASFMMGLPTETKEEAKKTVDMIVDIDPEHPTPFYFLPIPGTDIYKYCVENDLIINKDKSIARTGTYEPTIRGIDYGYLDYLRKNELSKCTHIIKAFIK